ncbi:Basic membrane protein C precursor [Borrelia nietonii YOR]|uniref:Basic membrane protein C n=1 Tax=Borrelia nietonii YOR TaxID=1293576 RepID=A0ABN4C2V7_9SPIR|nr:MULTISPECIES: BMP family ABC transporter substrate-binding protein [Borrelia]AHH03365.1 Basic membrane protein C precursor [Borrelia nietonii YOR]AHH13880.1 Basic membrane protein C precursor [Borrelia hermsii MTW]UPA09090.1 BMP family ABC transporter substrate-binding protein [Borrelia nietonii YOR]
MSKNLCFIILFILLFVSCFSSKESSSVAVSSNVVMGIVFPGNFDDKGYFQNALDGAISIRDEFGIKLISKVLTPYPAEGKILMTADEVLAEDVYALQKDGVNFTWFISAHFSDSALRFSHENPNVFYGIVDPINYDNVIIPKNFLAINFRSEEGAFLAGYLAAKMSKSNRVGFLTGVNVGHIERFLVGFRAGAFYANPKTRVIFKRILDDFSEVSGKFVAEHMYVEDGIDVIFPVMGSASLGVFAAAKELGAGHYVIGANKDQAYLAPGHVITSVIKDVGKAIYNFSLDVVKNNRFNGGRMIERGMKEGVIDIVKDPNIIGNNLFNTLIKIQNAIVNGDLIIPSTEHEFDLFKARL